MRREFLKNLGIEDKDIIDKILDENSTDIGRAKGELETYKTKVTELEGQLTDKAAELTKLQKTAGDVEALNQKITQLETDKTNLTNELANKVGEIQKTHAIENGIRDAKGKNIKAIMALLDNEKITFADGALNGLTEQLEALAKAEDSSMLFGDTKPPVPSGLTLNDPPNNGGKMPPTVSSFADAVAKALTTK